MRRLALMTSIIVASCVGLNGCGTWGGPSKTDSRAVYVWPAQVCPSAAAGVAGQPNSLGAIVISTLIGNVVSGLVGIPADALKQAADADNQGLKATGTNARFYYNVQNVAIGAKSQVQVSPPSCYVVAYTSPIAAGGKHWCEDAVFAKSVPGSCQNGFSRLKGLKVREELNGISQPGIESLAVPELYLEIGFENSGYENVVRPTILAMHYPESLLQPGSTEPRMVTLQMDMTSAFPNEPFKAASVTLVIPNVKPGATIDQESTRNAITGWTTVPMVRGPAEIVPPSNGSAAPYGPVTIKATLNEVGDPHRFLQAFAKAFGASSGDYAKAITNELSPLGQETAQQAKDKAKAEFMTALAAAQKSRADLLSLCINPPATAQAKAVAESTWTTALANQLKANNAADLAGQSRLFMPPDAVNGFSKCW